MSISNSGVCWFCGMEVTKNMPDVVYSYGIESYLHLSCLQDECSKIENVKHGKLTNKFEALIAMKEMNENGYEIHFGEE
ncbi:MAG: hypothetical protein PHC62_06845 [Candidatus Izemoplasmatales bacterium]|nr:hypothetical protein [Candidatus Izemoplasmatales bacterium]